MNKKVIGLVGLIASGKGVAKNYLIKNYDAVEFRFSSILREALDILGIEQTRDNIINLSTWSRENFGNDLLAKAMLKKIEKSDAQLIIIDGIRRMDDILYIRDLDNFKMLAIEANSKIRYERSVNRNENLGDDKKSYQDFLNDHQKETEISIPKTMEKADYNILNEGSLEEYYQKIDELMKEI